MCIYIYMYIYIYVCIYIYIYLFLVSTNASDFAPAQTFHTRIDPFQ